MTVLMSAIALSISSAASCAHARSANNATFYGKKHEMKEGMKEGMKELGAL
jgi:hypothetical protein